MAQCITPFKMKDQEYHFPCGQCPECRKRRASGWGYRMEKEAERSTSFAFITLTYDNDHVPMDSNDMLTLWKPDVQNFLKRFRKQQNKKGIKYYAVGEYGKFRRPHYHIILFNHNQLTLDEDITKTWQKGYHHIGDGNTATVMYTLKYISKKGIIPQFKDDLRQKEFSLMSKRLGDNYLSKQMVKYHKQDVVNRYAITTKDGIKIPMPRYYKDKIFNSWDKIKIGHHFQEEYKKQMENKDFSTIDKELSTENAIKLEKLRKFENQKDNNQKL